MAPRYDRDIAKETEILQVWFLQSYYIRKCCLFQWIGSVLGDKLPNQDFETVLKDGTILCRLMNKIQPGSIKKFRETVVMICDFTEELSWSCSRALLSCSWRISRLFSVRPGSMESQPRSFFRPPTCLREETFLRSRRFKEGIHWKEMELLWMHGISFLQSAQTAITDKDSCGVDR